MGAMASQITTLAIVYSTVYSDADQRKHQSSAPLAFMWGTHRGPVNSPHKWPVTRKMFPLDDVIMFLCFRSVDCGGHWCHSRDYYGHRHARLCLLLSSKVSIMGRSRNISKPQNICIVLSHCFVIWQTSDICAAACHISSRYRYIMCFWIEKKYHSKLSNAAISKLRYVRVRFPYTAKNINNDNNVFIRISYWGS